MGPSEEVEGLILGAWKMVYNNRREGREDRCMVLVGDDMWELKAFYSDCSYFLIEKAKSNLELKVQMGEAVMKI